MHAEVMRQSAVQALPPLPPSVAAAASFTPPAFAPAFAPAEAPAEAPAATPRYHYRNPQNGATEGPFRLSLFSQWVAAGHLTAADVAAMRVWREGASEAASGPLADLLEVLAAAAAAR